MDKYYNDFFTSNIKDKNWLHKQELYQLYKKPQKSNYVNTAHYNGVFSEFTDQQADLLFLPNNNGYKYALVVTDIATKKSDAEPLKTKTSEEVMKAFKKIYNRKILKLPIIITTDSGNEFKGVVKSYFEKQGIQIRYGKPGRKSQLAMVERTNLYLGKMIFYRMQAQEILTGEVSKEWIEDLPKFIEYINEKRAIKPKQPIKEDIKCSGDACYTLIEGTKVRAILDTPIDYITDKKLHGKFRASDIRWDPEIRIIKRVTLLPGKPPLYLLNDKKDINKIDNQVAYTKNQLQVVGEEEPPNPKVIRGNPSTYVVQKIVDKKKQNGKIYYKVRWKGYKPSEDTWELRTKLAEDVPILVEEFEKNNK